MFIHIFLAEKNSYPCVHFSEILHLIILKRNQSPVCEKCCLTISESSVRGQLDIDISVILKRVAV